MLKFKTLEGEFTIIINKTHIMMVDTNESGNAVYIILTNNVTYNVTHIWSKKRNDWVEIDIHKLYDWIG